ERRELLHQIALPGLLRTAQDLVHVGRHLRLQHVGGVQLAEQADQLVLRRRVVAETLDRRIPQRLHRAAPVHQADHVVRLRVEAVHAARHAVLEHVPELAAVVVAMNAHVAAQARPQVRDPVPAGAIEVFAHGSACQSQRRSRSTRLCVQIQIRRRSSTSILPTPSMPGRRRSGLASRRASTRKRLAPSLALFTAVILVTVNAKLWCGMDETTSSPRWPGSTWAKSCSSTCSAMRKSSAGATSNSTWPRSTGAPRRCDRSPLTITPSNGATSSTRASCWSTGASCASTCSSCAVTIAACGRSCLAIASRYCLVYWPCWLDRRTRSRRSSRSSKRPMTSPFFTMSPARRGASFTKPAIGAVMARWVSPSIAASAETR